MRFFLLCFLFIFVLGLSIAPLSAAEDLTIVFEEMSGIQCGDEWQMEGLPFTILPLTENCFTAQGAFGWGMYNACMEIDVRSLPGLITVSASFTNYGDPGSVYVFLMDSVVPLRAAYCVESGVQEEILISADGLAIERVRIFSTSGLFHWVSFQYEAVSSEVSSWGSVKSLFR